MRQPGGTWIDLQDHIQIKALGIDVDGHYDTAKNNLVYGLEDLDPAVDSGFETFHFNVPDQLRGKTAEVRIDVAGNAYGVDIDNVYFGSKQLLVGNPSDARTTQYTNYLIERPQYSLSYDPEDRIPNWVGWTLNKDWLGGVERPEIAFRQDPELPEEFPSARDSDYTNSGYDRGHMAASSDRNRTLKDSTSTFYVTNIIPQHPGNNQNGPWAQLEDELQQVASFEQGDVHFCRRSVRSPVRRVHHSG